MVLPLLAAGAAIITGYFAILSVSILANWLSVALGLGSAAYITYDLSNTDFHDQLSFDSENIQTLTALVIGSVFGFVSFRLAESIFASVGFGAALVAVSVFALALFYSPKLVANVVIELIKFVINLLDALTGDPR